MKQNIELPKSLESAIKYNNKQKNELKSLNVKNKEGWDDWEGNDYVDKY